MLNPNDIASKSFDKCMAGYKPDEVDSYLEMVAKEMRALVEEKSVLENKIIVLADKIEEYREDEDSLKAALVGAQKLGETVIREAKEKADKIQREAAKKAEFTIADAKNAVQREQKALENIQAEVNAFKERLIETYRQHVEMINNLADFGPKPKKPSQEIIEKRERKEVSEEKTKEKSDIMESPLTVPNEMENTSPKLESFEISNTEDETFNINDSFNIDSDEAGKNSSEPTMSFRPPINDSKFGPLKFGNEYEVKREVDEVANDIKNKTFFRKKK